MGGAKEKHETEHFLLHEREHFLFHAHEHFLLEEEKKSKLRGHEGPSWGRKEQEQWRLGW